MSGADFDRLADVLAHLLESAWHNHKTQRPGDQSEALEVSTQLPDGATRAVAAT